MDGTAIVAIPSVDDKVNQLSSEKIPHMTLCYLGDLSSASADDLMRIMGFVQHAASQLSPFYMTVDHRGTLGPDDADVLFFDKRGWSFPRIADFQQYLLMDNTIRRLYDSVEQYPEWTPHLTLGYPGSPAKKDDSDHPGIHNVEFDRIAVWYGDFEGPTFRLKYDDYGMEVTMSDMTTAKLGEQATRELFHQGVKGMKWGVRKQRRADKRSAKQVQKAAKKLAKADAKWEKSIYTTPKAIAVHNAMVDHFNARIGALNDKHPDANVFDEPDTPASKAYMQDIMSLSDQSYAAAVKSVHGSSPSGKKRAEFVSDEWGARVEVRSSEVKHAATDDEPDLVVLLRREGGHVVEANTAAAAISHSEDVEDFLAHYGVKGMKWGVTTVDKASQPTLTREKKALRDSKDITVSQRKAGKYATARGGQRQKASDDAVKAVAARQKAKKSTTDSLTNDELKAANERMRLEQEYHKLNAKTKRRGESFIAQLFQSKEHRSVTADLTARAAKTIAKEALKP